MIKNCRLIILYVSLLALQLLDPQANAAPNQPGSNPMRSSAADQWDYDYNIGAEDLEAGKYLEAENVLSSALVRLLEAQKSREYVR